MKAFDFKMLGVKAMEVQKMRETCGGFKEWIEHTQRWLMEDGLSPRVLSNNSRIRFLG